MTLCQIPLPIKFDIRMFYTNVIVDSVLILDGQIQSNTDHGPFQFVYQTVIAHCAHKRNLVPAAKQSCILSFVKSTRVIGRGEEHASSSTANENVAESSPLEDSCAAAVRQRLAAAAEARALQEH